MHKKGASSFHLALDVIKIYFWQIWHFIEMCFTNLAVLHMMTGQVENLYRGATLYTVASHTVAALVMIHRIILQLKSSTSPPQTYMLHTYTKLHMYPQYVYLTAGISNHPVSLSVLWNKVCREGKSHGKTRGQHELCS